MDQDLFHKWFEQVFLVQTNNLPRPLLLIVDGHGSHFDVETLKMAVDKQVYVILNDILRFCIACSHNLMSLFNKLRIILCLPSNSTHVLQPLDVVFFNPLKIQWKTYVLCFEEKKNSNCFFVEFFPMNILKRAFQRCLKIYFRNF